ncbi:MAG: transcriptional regulator [Planctomycetaceae bacterium]|nr:transcriptional regulator [Planctomycetaceae bacterium]
MSKTKTYKSVLEMLGDIAQEDSTIDIGEFKQYMAERKLVKELAILRSSRGLSQEELAKKIGHSQSWASKLEHGTDDELSIGDLRAYLSVFGLEFRAGAVKQGATITDDIKLLAFAIRQKLIKLAEMAKEGDGLVEHIANFFGEAFENINRFVSDAAARLPRKPDNSPYISIVAVAEEIQSLEAQEKSAAVLRKARSAPRRRNNNRSEKEVALR